MHADRPTWRDGIVAGLLAGVVVAVFFLGVDVVRAGEPLRTPAFLGGALFSGGGQAGPGGIVLFTALHLLAFAGVGAGAVLVCEWAGLPHNVLLGAVYGLLVCTLLFYGSLVAAGTRVLPAPGWRGVLTGNMLAGVVLGGYLRWRSGQPGVLGIADQLRRHDTLREGLVAGLLGAAGVAVWFLVADAVLREPLFTPGALGSVLFRGAGGPAEVRVTFPTVLGYSLVHLSAFLTVGVVAAGLVRKAEEFPPLVFGIGLLAVVIELFFVGMVAVLGGWILDSLAWWSVLGGNVLAALLMGSYLWRAHPRLREQVRSDAMWEEA